MKRTRLGAMDYARELATAHGCGKSFEPIEVWAVVNGEICKANVLRVRGHCDNWYSAYDYADTDNGQSLSARYLFPTRTHKRPALVELSDDMGIYHDWCAEPKR